MVLHGFNVNMPSIADQRLSVCLLMLLFELLFDGKYTYAAASAIREIMGDT